MAIDNDIADETAEGGDGENAAPSAKKNKKKIIIIAAAAVVVLLLIGAGLYFSGILSKHPAEEVPTSAPQAAEDTNSDKTDYAYLNLPDMIVNLQAERNRPTFLKITMSLELNKQEDVALVQKLQPRIVDSFQLYLRELRVDELRGSAGLYRLREELLMRVQQIAAPVKVRDVLFKEMLVQ